MTASSALPQLLANLPHRLLLGPGPSNYPPQVYQALAAPVIGHLDPYFQEIMEDLKVVLRKTLRTQNQCTFVVSGPGTAGMQTAVMNLLEAGEKIAVCINGVFGARIAEMARRIGAVPIEINYEWGSAVTADKLDEALTKNPDCKLAFFVHAETSTGVLSNPAPLIEVIQKHNAISIVDVVTSLGGVEFAMDAMGIDVIYGGPQKCISGPPGLSPVSFSDKAVAKINARKTKVTSWLLDVSEVLKYWASGARQYHHTAPISALYGLYAALKVIEADGLENAWARHKANQQLLISGLKELGFELFVNNETDRLPSLTTVNAGTIDEALLRKNLLTQHNIEVGGGLGSLAGKGFRIGLMGHNSSKENVARLLEALYVESSKLK